VYTHHFGSDFNWVASPYIILNGSDLIWIRPKEIRNWFSFILETRIGYFDQYSAKIRVMMP